MTKPGQTVASMSNKRVYLFGGGKADGTADMKDLLGRQGRQPRRDGEPRPAGAARLHHHHRGLHRLLRQRPQAARRPRARRSRRRWPRSARRSAPRSATWPHPLLVSVRSGARASMPGMMDTILNLGLNDATVKGLAATLGRRALRLRQLPPLHPDVFRRGARRRSRRVRGHPRQPQEPQRPLARHRSHRRGLARGHRRVQGRGRARDRQAVPAGHAASSSGAPSAPCSAPGRTRAPTPTAACTPSPTTGARPSTCRPWCSATWAQSSATGVAFTRNPSTGARELYGEFLVNAQGEDVVAGIRTPQPLTEAARQEAGETARRSKR